MCHMWKSGGSSRLKNDDVGTGFGGGLDGLEQLLTLKDTVVLCIDYLEIQPEPGGCLAGTVHLFDLEIVAVVQYRKQESRFGHKPPWVQQNDSPKQCLLLRNAGNEGVRRLTPGSDDGQQCYCSIACTGFGCTCSSWIWDASHPPPRAFTRYTDV